MQNLPRIKMAAHERWRIYGLPLWVAVLTAMVGAACRQPESVESVGVATSNASASAASEEQSVKPGINQSYRDANVETFISRFEAESREIYHQRRRIVEDVDLQPGMDVADVGAGTGFMTELFAREVGGEGTVYAVDITPEFLSHIRKKTSEAGLTNVKTVLCKEDSVELPDESVDLVFICDTYHHFEYPRGTMGSVFRALRPGGRLVVIDFIRIPGVSRAWILGHVRAGRGRFTTEIIRDGFELLDSKTPADYLQENYLMQFTKPE